MLRSSLRSLSRRSLGLGRRRAAIRGLLQLGVPRRSARGYLSARSFLSSADAYSAESSRALQAPEEYWLEAAKRIDWYTPPQIALDRSRAPLYQWFPDGELNTCYNALDRHLPEREHQTAIAYWSSVGGPSREISFGELTAQVSRFAGALAELGVSKGSVVLLYMPMVPEALVAMLACARLGAVHSVTFGGFAPAELAARIRDAAPTVVVTSSCGIEKGKVLPYAPMVREAISLSGHEPNHVVVHQRKEAPSALEAPLPRGWSDFDEASARATPHGCVPVRASDPLYILYTSGTTGRPKGVLRDNSHAVALQWTMDHFWGIRPGETYFAASDIGWVVGHSYACYGPLLHGCTTVLFEGKPVGTPDAAEYWRVVARHRVNVMFTAPTALRALRKFDPETRLSAGHDLSSLRTLFVAGERCDPDTLDHFHAALGIPVIDNWWQTETGSPITGVVDEAIGVKSGSCSLPLPGYDVRVLDAATGDELPRGTLGSLAAKLPLPPGTMQSLYRDEQRFVDAYLSEFEGYHSLGDAGVVDEDGYVHVTARVGIVAQPRTTRRRSFQAKGAPRALESASLSAAGPLQPMAVPPPHMGLHPPCRLRTWAFSTRLAHDGGQSR